MAAVSLLSFEMVKVNAVGKAGLAAEKFSDVNFEIFIRDTERGVLTMERSTNEMAISRGGL